MSSFSTPVPINLHDPYRITPSSARIISVFLSSVYLFHLAFALFQCSVDMCYNFSALVNGLPVCLEGADVRKTYHFLQEQHTCTNLLGD